jgi:hypothetical protein
MVIVEKHTPSPKMDQRSTSPILLFVSFVDAEGSEGSTGEEEAEEVADDKLGFPGGGCTGTY